MLRRVRCNVQEDILTVYRLYSFEQLPEKRYALSGSCNIYSRMEYSRLGVGLNGIWLADKEGGKDVRLLGADLLLRDNRQTAEKTAKQISLATGLSLLEYIEPSEKVV